MACFSPQNVEANLDFVQGFVCDFTSHALHFILTRDMQATRKAQVFSFRRFFETFRKQVSQTQPLLRQSVLNIAPSFKFGFWDCIVSTTVKWQILWPELNDTILFPLYSVIALVLGLALLPHSKNLKHVLDVKKHSELRKVILSLLETDFLTKSLLRGFSSFPFTYFTVSSRTKTVKSRMDVLSAHVVSIHDF